MNNAGHGPLYLTRDLGKAIAVNVLSESSGSPKVQGKHSSCGTFPLILHFPATHRAIKLMRNARNL